MRIFKSFLIRLSVVALVSVTLSFVVMGLTLMLQGLNSEMQYSFMLAFLFSTLLLLNIFLVRKLNFELTLEVARLLYPSGAALSLLISLLFLQWLDDLIPGEGRQHYVLIFVGLGIAAFLLIRCFDIKWLRSEAEMDAILKREKS